MAADTSEVWKQQEREIVDKFFRKKAPETLKSGDNTLAALLCTEDSCVEFTKTILQIEDVVPVDNQGSNSFTLISQSRRLIIQFRLRPLRTDTIRLASEIYGHLVPNIRFHEGFPLPVYSCKALPGRVHLLQPFPKGRFPLAREMVSVRELGAFIAKAAFFEQPKSFSDTSWTSSAKDALCRLSNNSSLSSLAPDLLHLIVETLQPQVHLLETLPAVLTHHDFSQVNSRSTSSSTTRGM